MGDVSDPSPGTADTTGADAILRAAAEAGVAKSTMAEQRARNPHGRDGMTEAAFVEMTPGWHLRCCAAG